MLMMRIKNYGKNEIEPGKHGGLSRKKALSFDKAFDEKSG